MSHVVGNCFLEDQSAKRVANYDCDGLRRVAGPRPCCIGQLIDIVPQKPRLAIVEAVALQE